LALRHRGRWASRLLSWARLVWDAALRGALSVRASLARRRVGRCLLWALLSGAGGTVPAWGRGEAGRLSDPRHFRKCGRRSERSRVSDVVVGMSLGLMNGLFLGSVLLVVRVLVLEDLFRFLDVWFDRWGLRLIIIVMNLDWSRSFLLVTLWHL